MNKSNDSNEITSSQRPLTKQNVIIAAIKIADMGGMEALSMRKLGMSLGVKGMAIYHHFANKEDLIDGMVDSVHGEIEIPLSSIGWIAAMRQRAVSALHALARHPWAVPLMESRLKPGVASMRLINSTVKCLSEEGFSIGMVAHTISILDSYTFGFAQQLRSPTESIEQEANMGKDIIAQFPFDLYPYVGQLIREHVTSSGYRTIKEFEFGLDLILDGIDSKKAGGNE